MSPNIQLSFWERVGLEERHRDVCLRALQDLYPGCDFEEFRVQGYCSFTIRVSRREGKVPDGKIMKPAASKTEEPSAFVVQIRPEQHSLELDVVQAASVVYGGLAPKVQRLNCNLPGRLHVFRMDLMPGTPLSYCYSRLRTLDAATWTKRVNLVQSFAAFLARAWPLSKAAYFSRYARADSPLTDAPSLLSACTGTVGVNIIPKLNKLARELPDSTLRERAAVTLNKLLKLKDFPVVLNHGDLIPTNICVDENSWRITGLVDWAEAEWLPFGTCLYGLEYLLGHLEHTPANLNNADERPAWRYSSDTSRLREIFWARLCEEAPGIRERREDVLLARDLGVLLWYGYAWDEGAINRVVNEEDDTAEVECLRSFLAVRHPESLVPDG